MDRARLERLLQDSRRATVVAAVVAVPIIVLDAIVPLTGTAATLARIVNWAVWGVFLAQLLLFFAARGVRWTLTTYPVLVLVVVLTPPIAPAALQFGRLLRLLPLLRLAGAAGIMRHVFSVEGLRYAAVLLALAVLGGGALLPTLEPAQHLSAGDGIWWATETVTTVGYGDIVPHTTPGRLLGVAIMVVGIGTAALLIGAAAQRFTGAGSDGEDLADHVARLTDEVAALRAQLAERPHAGE